MSACRKSKKLTLLLLKCWAKPVLVEAVKNDSFLGTMTAGSENVDFLGSQPLSQVNPVLLVPQSCLEVQWLGQNRCPISWCVLNFTNFYSTNALRPHSYDSRPTRCWIWMYNCWNILLVDCKNFGRSVPHLTYLYYDYLKILLGPQPRLWGWG